METGSSTITRMLTGKCECGAVRYRVADEFLYAGNCHCSNCRAATGSALKAVRDELEDLASWLGLAGVES